VVNSYEEEKAARGTKCYICGNAFGPGGIRQTMKLDNKEREVHGNCKLRVKKAQEQLASYGCG